jgi:tetratricopeptide (TPR) repeat protein
MSLILDALRQGRQPATPRKRSTGAQTEAVLQTLGYTRPRSNTPFAKIRRLVGYAVAAVILATALWAAVTRVTRPYLRSEPPAAVQMHVVASALLPDAPTDGAASTAGTLVSENDHFQLAIYYQKIGDFENSLLHYRAVLQRNDLNAEAHHNLGVLYRDKGLSEEARKEFDRAVAINERYVKAHYNLALIADHSGDRALALTHYGACLRYATDQPDLLADVRERMAALGPRTLFLPDAGTEKSR